jgi:hypothetical protein
MAEANFQNSLHIQTYLMFLSILPWLIVALIADVLESTSSRRGRAKDQENQGQDLPLVRPPHGLDDPLRVRM